MTWRKCRLGDVLTLKRGHDLPDSQRRKGEVPVVSSSGITGHHSEARAKAPGVVTGRYGTLGEVFYIEEDYWPLNTALYVVDFKGNRPRFVAYLLESVIRNHQSDKAAVPGVNRNVLHEINVRCPDETVQDRVVSILSSHDDLIENNRRRMALLEESARQLFREWFVRLRFPGAGVALDPGDVPVGWNRTSLGECADLLSGGTPPKARSDYWTGDVPWVSSGELTSMRVRRTSLMLTADAVKAGSRLVPRNTILAVVRGMSLAKEFRLGLTSVPMSFNQDIKAIIPRMGVDTLLLFHALDAQREQIRDRAGEASHGTKKLESAVLRQLPILVPPQALQRQFRAHTEPLHDLWDNLNQQNYLLRAARDLLLPRLMSGQIPV